MNTISDPSVEDYEKMLGVNLGLDIMNREPVGTLVVFDRLHRPVSEPAKRMMETLGRHAHGFNSAGIAFVVDRLTRRAAEAGCEVSTELHEGLPATVFRKVHSCTSPS